APELHRLGLLTSLDVMPLAAYCEAHKVWREASEMLARTPEDEQLVVDGKPNPLVRIVRNAAHQMTAIGAQFGLSPCARLRVAGITLPKATEQVRRPDRFRRRLSGATRLCGSLLGKSLFGYRGFAYPGRRALIWLAFFDQPADLALGTLAHLRRERD